MGNDLFFGGGWMAQVEVEEFNDIVSGDQRSVGMGEEALLGNEEECKKAHGKMVMEGSPAAHLILGHANLAFGIF